jgi:hypothetical protein
MLEGIYPIPLQQVPEDLRPVLVLHVKKKWFDQIRAGTKKHEFRAIKPYWKKRLEGRQYAAVVISNLQATAFSDPAWLIFPWNGYAIGGRAFYSIPLLPTIP